MATSKITMVAAALLFALPAAAQTAPSIFDPGGLQNNRIFSPNQGQQLLDQQQANQRRQEAEREQRERQRREDVMRYYASPQGVGAGPYSR